MSLNLGFKEAAFIAGVSTFASTNANAGLILAGDAEFDNNAGYAQVTANVEDSFANDLVETGPFADLIGSFSAAGDNIAQVTINGETLTADSISVFIRNDFLGLNNISWSITDFDQTLGGNVIDRLTFNGTGVTSDDLFDNFGQLDTATLSLQGVGVLTADEAFATIETKVNEVPEGPGLPLMLTGLAALAYSRREKIAQAFAPAQPA